MGKKYELKLCNNGAYYLWQGDELVIPHISFDKFNKEDAEELCNLLNEYYDESMRLNEFKEETITLFQTAFNGLANLRKKAGSNSLEQCIIITFEENTENMV